MGDLNTLITNLNIEEDKPQVDKLICDYRPFIIKAVSDAKHQYVSVENDEEYSVGLLAFVEAIKRYDIEKGSFIPYAKLVITSRVKNYVKQEQRFDHADIDELKNSLKLGGFQEESDLKYEILQFEEFLKVYGITFEDLIEASPKHRDTRETAIGIARKVSGEEDLVNHLTKKKRLPISKIAERFFVSVKILKRSKEFIIANIIIIIENLRFIKDWIKK